MNIRPVTVADACHLAEYYRSNTCHFKAWVPFREDGYYSKTALQSRLSDYEEQHRSGSAAHFIGVNNGEVVAHCSLTNVVYGSLRAGFIGYGVDHNHEGSGTMAEVCKVAIGYAFNDLELNRIMANYMPANVRSGNLLKRLGFLEEGIARKYLKINGKWEDHVLTSLISPP